MEIVSLGCGAMVLGYGALCAGLLWAVLVSASSSGWAFEFGGRRFRVHRYASRRVEIRVDGTLLPPSRVATNPDFVLHAVPLPDGRQLDLKITKKRCRAAIGEALIYDSDGPLAVQHRAHGPGPARSPRAPEDPRWNAAAVLLRELEDDPEVSAAAARLGAEVRAAMFSHEQARQAADAHAALGGTGDDATALVARREAVVEDLLRVVRELHLAASGRSIEPTSLPKVEETLRRLEAEREVDSARLRLGATAGRQANASR
jgi:hypothetical protein